MTITISVEEAQTKLVEIIGEFAPGDEVTLTEGSRPVAQLRSVVNSKPRPRFGSCRGMLTVIAEDDDHLHDFREYMP